MRRTMSSCCFETAQLLMSRSTQPQERRYNLQAAIIRHHELFRPGKTVSVLFGNLDVNVMQNSALVRGTYSKTSDQYEQQGFAGLTGQVLWLLSKQGEQMANSGSAWTEEKKQ